ncbi:DDE-type integrase/transposase/recombinase [Azotobacter vinelandii]
MRKKPFKRYPLGYLHIDITETRTTEGKACLFVAIDRTSKFVHAGLYAQATRKSAVDFLHATLKALPYRVHTVLTDNGIQFAKKRPKPRLIGRIRSMRSASGTASNTA